MKETNEITLYDIFSTNELREVVRLCRTAGPRLHAEIKKIVSAKVHRLNELTGRQNDPDGIADFITTATMSLIPTVRRPTK